MTLEPKAKRDRIFEAIRDLLIRESQNRPLVVAIEDLHWIDKTSEEFLDYLVGSLSHTRCLMILLYRPEYTHQWGVSPSTTVSAWINSPRNPAQRWFKPSWKEARLSRSSGN